MKTNALYSGSHVWEWRVLIGFVLASALEWATLTASAIQRDWAGSGPFVQAWSNPNNWSPTGVPQNGDNLRFDDVFGGMMLNDVSNLTVGSLEFRTGPWQLAGNELGVNAGIASSENGSPTISCPIRLEAFATISALAISTFPEHHSDLHITGAIDLNGHNLRLLARSGSSVELAGPISGNGNIRIDVETFDYFSSSGEIRFSGSQANTFNGSLTMNSQSHFNVLAHVGANLILDKQSAIAIPGALFVGTNGIVKLDRPHQIADDAAVNLGAGAYLLLQGNTESIGSLNMVGSYSGLFGYWPDMGRSVVDTDGDTLSVEGNITASNFHSNSIPTIIGKLGLPPGDHTITVGGNQFYGLDIQAQILGDGGFAKSGDKALALQGSNTFNGDAIVAQGTVVARHPNALGSTLGSTCLTNSGTLSLDNVAISGETLFARGNFPFSPETPGSGLIAYGTNVWGGPIVLDTNLLVSLETVNFSGPISGPGTLHCAAGSVQISGADANTFTGALLVKDLVLLSKSSGVAAFGGPLVVGGGPLYPVAVVRWLQNYQAIGANVTLFENGSVDLNDHNDDFGAITFDSTASISTGTGELGVYGLVTVNGSSFTASAIYGRLGLPSGYREFLINDLGYGLEIGATIVGPGHLRKTGPGILGLGGINTYAGLTVVDDGTLNMGRAESLGASGTGTIVNEGATLAFPIFGFDDPVVSEPLAIRGTGYMGSGALYAGRRTVLRNPFPSIYACIDLTTNATIRTASLVQLIVDGFITGGAGSLTKTGPGTLVFSNANANAYSGDTIISEGTLELHKPNNVISIPGKLVLGPGSAGPPATARWFQSGPINASSTVTVNANSLLDLNGFDQTLARLNLNDGGNAQTGAGRLNITPGGVVQVGSLSPSGSHASSAISGNIGLPANNFISFNVAPYAIFPPFASGPELDVPAIISVNGAESPSLEPAGFSKVSLGWMRLLANNTYKGEAFVSGGTLQVEGLQPQSLARVGGGARLQGSGTIGHVNFQGSAGVIAPGASPGILTVSNFNAEASGNGIFQVELNGTNPGSDHDQVNVRGTVTLSGMTLAAALNFSPAVSNQFTIINNDGADAVIGTFNGLPQNSTFALNGEEFRISYTGGSGNDIVLTRTATPLPPRLTIASVSPSFVRLLWPTNDPDFRLQFTTNLTSTNWVSAFPLPAVIGTNYVVTNATSGTDPSCVTPAAWYRMGENDPGAASGFAVTTTSADSIGTNHLKQFGSPLYTSAVSSNASNHVASSLAVQLNGSSQYFSNVLVSSAVDNFGLEAWVKPNTASSTYHFVAYNGNTANNGWGIAWQGGAFQGWFGNVVLFGSGGATTGTWMHVALVRNDAISTLYVNGVATGSPTAISPNPPAGGFALGVRPETPTVEFFNGSIDEVRAFTFSPGQFCTNDLLLNRTTNQAGNARFYQLIKP